MEETSSEIMKKMIVQELEKCTDADFLDLIYKMLIMETGRE